MDMVASALAGGIAQQFPDKFSGAVDAPEAGLRSALTRLLSEHVYLAAMATTAALGGRDPEFKAAASALDGNSRFSGHDRLGLWRCCRQGVPALVAQAHRLLCRLHEWRG